MNLKDDGYPPVLLMADLCRVLRLHENTVYRRIAVGQVPAYRRLGRRYEWDRDDVQTWLCNRRAHLRKVG